MTLHLLLSLIAAFSVFGLASTPPPTVCDQSEVDEFLAYHNDARSKVGVGPLVWSEELAIVAQEWANQLAANCTLSHRPNNVFGENCAMNFEGTLKSGAVQWMAEKKYFRNQKLTSKNWYRTGHYSQMVWGRTTKVGAAKARCRNGAYVIVANYDPPGNYMGQRAY